LLGVKITVMKSFRDMLPERGARGRSTGGTARGTNAWIRWSGFWDALFYVLLVVALASNLLDMGPFGWRQLAIIGLTVLFGLWYWFMIMRHRRWIQKDFPMLVYAAGAIALCITLIWINASYYLLLFVMYSQLYSFLRIRWAIPASVVLTAFLVLRGILEAPEAWPYWVFIATLSVLFGIFFALWINSIIEQSQERRQLIEELESTREELAARQHRAGILEERSRLAREIHDTLAQGFISIVAHLEAAEGALSPGSDQARRHLQQARRTARDNLVEARHLVAALRPEILGGSSLSGALKRLAVRWSEESGVPASVSVTGDELPLAQGTQVALLRAAQEALSNTRRHAGAGEVSITLSYMDDLVALDVQDDGNGFEPDLVAVDANGGFGLRAMRERVEALGGSLLVESEPGAGCTLVVELPLEEAVTAKELP
jgi:signal transduction histidine kinase